MDKLMLPFALAANALLSLIEVLMSVDWGQFLTLVVGVLLIVGAVVAAAVACARDT